MRRAILTIFFSAISLNLFASREVFNINRGWQFTPGWEVQKGISTEVNLPHTWNLDALSGKIDYFRGLGNYVKYINAPKNWKDKKVFIHFNGSNQTTTLFVNGKSIGTHKGGYTAFTMDITPHLRLGEKNALWVRVTNATDLDVMPLLGDFNMYGGIYRDVTLIVTPRTHIEMENYGSCGVFITPTNVSETKADVRVKTKIAGGVNSKVEFSYTVKNSQDSVVFTSKRYKSTIPSNARGLEHESIFTIENPILWSGTENPHQYTLEITVNGVGSSDSDVVSQKFGLRYFDVDKDNQFLLNGKPYKIHGVGKHQDWAGIGNAISRENMDKDLELMLEMGVNAVRLAHYPHDPYFIDRCDQAGIIVWSEIPFVGPGGYRDKGFNDTDDFRENGKIQLREMIRQLYNHPSILFWGLFNELIQTGDDPVQYVRELNALAKEEDPTRITVAASNQDGELNLITDLITFNKYYGWYAGMPADMDKWGAILKKEWPKLKAGLSEYGAGASIYHQTDSLVKTVPESYWHTEQWQTYFHEQHWKTIAEKPYFWGTFAWAMFDFGAAHRTEGQIAGVNDKGLVTFDRAVRKDAFYFYKANWNKQDPFVYIADRRLKTRTRPKQSIKIYSNQPQVEILIDGVAQPAKKADGSGIFLWENLPFSPGEHTVEAFAADCKSDKASFTIEKQQISLTPKD